MSNILVLEDEQNIREFIAINMKRAGYEPFEAGTLEEARAVLCSAEIDIAIVDVMLPDGDGIDFAGEIRQKDPDTGIIVLTAKSREEDKISGLANGADDYITKPFSTAELNARVGALQRRLHRHKHPAKDIQEICDGQFALDVRNRTLYQSGKKIELTYVEYEMLKFLMQNARRALSREEILREVWGNDFQGEVKIVDVNVRRLRIKLEKTPSSPEWIRTVWGYGYQWGAKDE